MTTQIDNHVALARARLKEQFKEKTNYVALLDALVSPIQEAEDAMWQLYSERWIDTAEGDQLDNLGTIVGRDRGGLDDDDYRAYLRAQVAANRSNGTVADLIAIARLVIDDEDAGVLIEPQYPAGVVMRIEDVASIEARMDALITFLRAAKSAGVRIILEYWTHATETFQFATATFLNGGESAGATTVDVDSTAAFPSSGSITLSAGLAVQETKAYTGKTATTFTGVTALTNAHADNAAVTLSDGVDNGLGDEGDATVGGDFAGAKD